MESLSSIHEQYARDDENKKHAEEILVDLGLNMEDLRNKKVLDLGAGKAELGKAAKQEGIDVVSMDQCALEENREGVDYVIGNAKNTPFKDENFDLIISHAAPPLVMVKNLDEVKAILDEVKRVLKVGGEFRFGPLGMTPEVFGDEKLFTDEEDKFFGDEQRIERIKEKSLEFLKRIDPSIAEDRSVSEGFYFFKKS